MQEKIKEIAARIRELREISDITPDDMAAHLNVAPDVYARYESAEEDIPASILYEISHKLNIDMAVLLTGETPRMHIFTVTRKGTGVSVERRKAYKYQNLAANFIHKKAEPFLVTVEPKPVEKEVNMNSHPGQEFNFILEGRMKYYIHENEIILEEGDSIFFDSNYNHAMESLDGEPARFLAIIF